MPNVLMPDGVTVAFPDDMPPEQIKGLIASKFPESVPQAPQDPLKGANTGVGRTALNQSMQGATFGLADEIQAGIGALYAKAAGVDGSLTDLYSEALDSQRKDLAAQMKERPVLSVASNLGGALVTGGAAASTAPGKAALNWAGRGGTGARIAKGALTGATSGAAYGFGSAEGGAGERLEGALSGAILGGAVGAALPAVGAAVKSSFQGSDNLIKGMGARTVEELDEASRAIKASGSAFFQEMKDAGVTFKPKAAQKVALGVQKQLADDGILNPRLHGKIIGLVDDLKDAAKKPDFGLEELHQWRRLFGDVAGNYADKDNARKATLAIRSIDNFLDDVKPSYMSAGGKEAIAALNMGKAEWARMSKFDRVADIIKRSDGDANKLKSGLKRMLDDPRKTRGFSKEEMKALKEAARMTPGEGLMKAVGKFGFDLGGSTTFGNTALPVGSLAFGAAPLTAAGTATRYGQKALARGKAEKLLQAIEGRVTTPPLKLFPKMPNAPALPGVAALKTPTETDIKLLRGNRKLAPKFDEVFGEGAAEKALKK